MKKLLYILLFVPLAFFGQENYSLSFDGVLNNIVIPEIPSYEENTHSILIWFNNSQVNQGDIISKDDELISKRQWLLEKLASNSIKAHVWTNENLYTITTEPISQNKWYHLAQIWDGSILSLYIDGELIDSIVTDETGLRVSDCPIRIAGGAIEPGPGFYLQSHLEDAQIWNIPLSEQQIQSYMACPPLGIEEGLVGYWNFNEGSGNIVYDISGNGNHGVINGATYSEDVPQENDCIEGCIDSSAVNYNNTAHINDGSCISQEEYTIDSLNSVVEQATNSLSSLQQALDTWNTTIYLSAGWNMFGYGCPSSIDLVQGLSSHTELIAMVKDNNGSAYIPEFDFNGIGDLIPGFGYQIKVTEAIEGFSLCDWYVNDIPEDNIVSLQDSIDMLNSDILDLECINQVACSFNIELNECEFPQEGYDCDGNYILQIGDEAYGGIVFYIDETNQYGLVAAIDDLDGVYQWGCSNYTIPGADGTAIGTGYQNTLDIVSGCNQPATAAKQAVEFESEIYTDWYLPSINELVQIYNTIGPGGSEGNIGDFENTYYWSSSQYNNHDAWILNFYNNYVERDDKPHSFKVRVIRAFGNWTMGCMDSLACNFNTEANMADGSCVYPEQGYDCEGNINVQVGDEAFGGIVFYVEEGDEGKYGLVAALEDLEETYHWGCYGDIMLGADQQGIGFGLQNTNEILLSCSDRPIAASVALDYQFNEFSDWYLPSKDELRLIYTDIGNIDGFVDNFYWSSSENDLVNYGWGTNFSNGWQTVTNYSEEYTAYVRPICAFGNWAMGCMDETACNYNSEANMADESCEYTQEGYDCEGNITEYIVGMHAEGGIVFYVDETGEHGLVAAMEDIEGTHEWGCFEENVSGADGEAIGTGYQNTMDIVNQGCVTENGGITAAKAALDAEVNGYSDWYLPSKDELVEMYNTIGNGSPEGNIGGFSNDYYWSSSEYSYLIAWLVNFNIGSTGYNLKGDAGRVRVIRAF